MDVVPTVWQSDLGEFSLRPWPHLPADSLQGWDGADRLFARLLSAESTPQHCWVLNDHWGALTACLAAAGSRVSVTLDSASSRLALLANLSASGLDSTAVTLRLPLQSPVAVPDLVVIRVPRALDLLREQLAMVAASCAPGTRVWLLAMDKYMPVDLAAICADTLAEVGFFPGRFKAHCLAATVATGRDGGPPPECWSAISADEHGLALAALPGVFSRHAVDPGGRFLAANLTPAADLTVADLGCGNGLLGLSQARISAPRELWFCDDSWRAVESARRNVRENFPSGLNAHFLHGCGLDGVAGHLDRVLLNPPFHRGNAVDARVGSYLIREAGEHLRPDGELWLVANRHLDYRRALARAFSDWRQVAQNPKFRVICARR